MVQEDTSDPVDSIVRKVFDLSLDDATEYASKLDVPEDEMYDGQVDATLDPLPRNAYPRPIRNLLADLQAHNEVSGNNAGPVFLRCAALFAPPQTCLNVTLPTDACLRKPCCVSRTLPLI